MQVDAEIGPPRVNYRETITKRANFDYLHKKQSGGQGQYGRVVGYIEPLPEGSIEKFEYANEIVGNAIPPNYLPSCKKGFEEAINSGALPFMPSSYLDNFVIVPRSMFISADKLTYKDGAVSLIDHCHVVFMCWGVVWLFFPITKLLCVFGILLCCQRQNTSRLARKT